MTLENLLRDVTYKVLQEGEGLSQEVTSICFDSRKVTAGGLFICLLGPTVDRHEFIDDVALAGAGAVLVEKFDNEFAPRHDDISHNPWLPDGSRIHPRPPGYTGAAQQRTSYPPGLTVIQVPNTRQAMALIAANAYNRPAEKLRLVGVTGTNGKTTTTHFIEEILRGTGHKTGLIGTNGIKIGQEPLDIPFATSTTPDPLELQEIFAHMVERGVKYVIMEVSSHALALYKVEGLIFDVGVFTNLTQDHLDLHGTMDNYRLAKAQLFAQSRHAVVNIEDASTPVMLAHFSGEDYLTYGIDSEAGLVALHIEYLASGVAFDIGGSYAPRLCEEGRDEAIQDSSKPLVQRGAPIIAARYRLRRMTGRPGAVPTMRGAHSTPTHRFTLKAKAKFNVYNALAAIGVCLKLGLPLAEICKIKIKGIPGRVQDVPNNIGAHVLVDYAHSPDGILNIIKSVREFTTGQIVIIFGCGGDRDKGKRSIMGRIAGKLADYCILTSDNPRTECPHAIIAQIEEGTSPTGTPYEIIENRRDAIFAGVGMLGAGDALIIAGKGHEDYQIVGAETVHFSDYETAVEALGRDNHPGPTGHPS